MRAGRIIIRRFHSLFRRSRADADLQREIDLHIEQLIKEAMASGAGASEARRMALEEFGSRVTAEEECRDMRRVSAIEHVFQDLRYGLRSLMKTPAFTVVAVLTLALGIGANSAIFSVIDAAILRPLPYPHPERLLLLFEKDILGPGGGPNVVSFANFADWEHQAGSFSGMAAGRENSFNLGETGAFGPERIDGAIFSWGLFRTLEVQPVIGRAFTEEEDRPGAAPVAVISYALWQSRFGGTPGVLQRKIRLDGLEYAVIGVMPKGFAYPARNVELWVPVQQILHEDDLQDRGGHQFYVVARLRPGVTAARATAEVDGLQHQIYAANPGKLAGRGAVSLPLRDITTYESKTSLCVLLAAAGCLLLIACVNISNLLFARGLQRSREFAIRTALGASRSRVLQQVLTESVVLAAMGAAAGLLLALGLTHALAAHASVLIHADDIDTSAPIGIDNRVLGFTVLLSLAVGIAAGLLPARWCTRADAATGLKEGGRSATAGKGHQKLRTGLVAAEFALSVVLLTAAGLMIRSFFELQNVRPGVRIKNVITAGIALPESRYRNREQVSNYAKALLDRLSTLPGVRGAGLVNCLPVGGYCGDNTFEIEGRPLPPRQFRIALNRAASPGYFRAAGIPLLQGRTFNESDGRGLDDEHPRESAVIISESMAKTFWPGGDALGQRIYFDEAPNAPRYRVIGIAGDVLINLADHRRPTMYLPLLEGSRTDFYALLHTESDPVALAPALRNVMKAADPDIPPFKIRTMAAILGQSSEQRAFTAVLFGSFAGLAVVLSLVGLYGVLAYLISQRVPEIGIRMALGADRSEVFRLILLFGFRPVLIGLSSGLIAALGLMQILRSLLFGVKPTDGLTFMAVPFVMLSVAVIACIAPAWHAARLDPATALRSE